MSETVFVDLYKQLTLNPEYRDKLESQMKKVDLADKSGDRDGMIYELNELLKLCDYNASLLVPYFFPRYPESEPMTLWNRPHAFSMMAMTLLGSTTIKAGRQVGKCVGGDTVIKTNRSDIHTIKDLFDITKENKACR